MKERRRYIKGNFTFVFSMPDEKMRKYLSIAIALILISIFAVAQSEQDYDDYVKNIQSVWDKELQEKEFQQYILEQNTAYQEYVSQEEEAYKKYVEDIEKKWNEFMASSKEQWVDYGENKDVKSIVDFTVPEDDEEIEEDKVDEKPVQEPKPEEKPEPDEKPKIEIKPEFKEKPEEKPQEQPSEQIKPELEKKPDLKTQEKPETEIKPDIEKEQTEKEKTKPEEQPSGKIKPGPKTQDKPDVKKEQTEKEKPKLKAQTVEQTKPKVEKKPDLKTQDKPESEIKPGIKIEQAKTEDKPGVKTEEKTKVRQTDKPEFMVEGKTDLTLPNQPAKQTTKKPGLKIQHTPKHRKQKGGRIIIEAIVPADAPDRMVQARSLIASQTERIFSMKNRARRNVLEGQVRNRMGQPVTPQNVRQFVQDEVLPKAKIDPEKVKSNDGVERIKVTVSIPMVPDHLKKRAQQYLSSTRKYCKQFKEDLPLVMAVIQTESYFNPLAKSHIPAYGLMQLVPRAGGRDAYRYVFNKDKAPKPDFLYVPDNNLLLGIAYINLIRDKYLYGINDPEKQQYLITAAYNGGIGNVIKKVLKKHNVKKMSDAELYRILQQKMPDETKDYLTKVTSRKKNYLAWQSI